LSWKRGLAATALRYSASLRALQSLSKYRAKQLTILAYHRVGERVDPEDYPFDHDFISATPKDFAWQMKYVKRHFNPITFVDVVAHLDGRKKLPPRPLIVTFDDGFDDNYHIAYPILKQAGVPATMFVCTGYIGQEKTFWFDRVVYLVKNTRVHQFDLGLPGGPTILEATARSRYQQARQLVLFLRSIDNQERLKYVELLEIQLGEALEDTSIESKPMTWEMVVEMANDGIEIGSHSVSHPNLTQLTPDALRQELVDSSQQIADCTGQTPLAIAYPAGDKQNFNDQVRAISESSGYSIAASYVSGVNPVDAMERYSLSRLHIESYTGKNEFAAMLELPVVFA